MCAPDQTGAVVRPAAVDVVGEEDEVEVSRERADVLDARARSTGYLDRDAVRAAHTDADAEEAGERQHVEERDRALDLRLDVDLARAAGVQRPRAAEIRLVLVDRVMRRRGRRQ